MSQISCFFPFLRHFECHTIGTRSIDDLSTRFTAWAKYLQVREHENLQKLIIGRELITSPDLLICFNPTWGLDVGAINYIHETLIKINEQNKSIILISTDTDELLKLSDKISVIHKGKLSKLMNAEEVTSEKLGILMGGGEID